MGVGVDSAVGWEVNDDSEEESLSESSESLSLSSSSWWSPSAGVATVDVGSAALADDEAKVEGMQ